MAFVELLDQFPEYDAKDLQAIVNRAAGPRMIALELGSWCGHSSSIIGAIVKGWRGTLYCVDRWDVYPEDEDASGLLTQLALEHDVLRVFRNNMKALGLADVVVPIVADTAGAARIIADESADLVFIDADHRYTPVRQDILTYWNKLKVGGVMCGHDYDRFVDLPHDEIVAHSEVDFHAGMHCGVVRAVDELFAGSVQWSGTSKVWAVTKQHRDIARMATTASAA